MICCIGFLKSIKCRFVSLNDVIKTCIKKLNRKKFNTPKGKMRTKIVKKLNIEVKGEKKKEKNRLIYNAVVVSTKKPWVRHDGSIVNTGTNRSVLLTELWKPLGSKIRGPISRELRKKRKNLVFKEIMSHAKRRL